MAAQSAALSSQRLVSRTGEPQRRPPAQDNHRGTGAKATGRALEIRDRRCRYRRRDRRVALGKRRRGQDREGESQPGPALLRDPQAVLEDVLDEYISIKRAHEKYGVVIKGHFDDYDLEVDYPATEALRKAMGVEELREPAE